jgi:hypothetical protein
VKARKVRYGRRVRPLVLLSALLLSCSTPPPLCPSSPAPPVAPLAVAPPVSTPVADTVLRTTDFSFAVRARPFANLAYHLDCLSGRIACEEKAFHAFWDPGWTPGDAAALAEWKAVHDLYDIDAPFEVDVGPTPMPLPSAHLSIDKQLRVASLLAVTPDDFLQNLRVLLPGPDAERLRRAAVHFQPRFEAFWSSTGEAVGARFRAGLEGLFTRGDVPAILARANRFYGSPLPTGALMDFDLVVVPVATKHSSGEQVVSHGLIEVSPDEKPEDRMDVVCHELFHFLYGSRTQAQQAALMKRFFASGDPYAELAYALLDESVATALGQGVVLGAVDPANLARRMSRDGGMYTVHSIDATAKGLLARTASDPTLGPPLDSAETVAALLASTRDAVGPDPAPLEYLRDVGGASDAGWWAPVMDAVLKRAHGNHTRTRTPLAGLDAVELVTHYPSLPVILLVPRDRLGALVAFADAIPKADRAAVAAQARKPGPFAYSLRRGPASWLFVVVADSPADAKRAAEALFFGPGVLKGAVRPAT